MRDCILTDGGQEKCNCFLGGISIQKGEHSDWCVRMILEEEVSIGDFIGSFLFVCFNLVLFSYVS